MLHSFAKLSRAASGAGALATALAAPGLVQAQAPGDPCREKGSPYTWDVQGQYTDADLAGIGSTVWSAQASVRRCLNSGSSLTGAVLFDDIDTELGGTTAGRVLVGYLARIDGKPFNGAETYWVYGANGTAGYEDYIVAEGWPPSFRKDQRFATSFEAVGGYAVLPSVDRSRRHNYLEQVYFDGRAAVFDKRAPSAGAPAYATETYEAATGSVIFTFKVDHAPFGSKFDVLLSQQHLFSDTLRVEDITTARVQWRLQRDHRLDHTPDRLIVGMQASVGDNDYRVLSLYLGKSF